jgi:signal transduction histidine kinase
MFQPARCPYAESVTSVAFWQRLWREATARDVLTALVMTVLTVFGASGEAHPKSASDIVMNGHHVPNTPDAALLLVAAAALVLADRRRHPLTVLAISTAAVAAYSLLGYVNGAALLSPTVALYTVAVTVPARSALTAALLTLAALMSSTAAANPFGITGGGFYLIPALVAAALFGGIAVSNRRAYVASIQARANDEASRRVGEERLRIARELHDVVAHTMSTINVQATAAAQVFAEQPEITATALQAIRQASKDGLRELRTILDVLRQADDAEPTGPAPGLAEVESLVSNAVQAGLPTKLQVTGAATPLARPVEVAAYRIIQEGLTNAIRHAGPASATVSLTYSGGELLIEVADDGRGALVHDGAIGHGLIGMRERAAAAGGTMRAGSAPGGGYLVTAQLPINGQREGLPQ